jgi:predicted nicotinamide N-methyase
LVSGVYEGGLKIWECSIDLVNYLVSHPEMVKDKRVLEIGCGQGLPGIVCLTQLGASQVTLQDYNQEVLDKATKQTVSLNLTSPDQSSKCSFLGGSWEHLSTLDSLKNQFDIILMTETLYNNSYYPSLLNFIDHCLDKSD